ncbi:D(2) dopamine receptor A [Holothuria leucospilota]|uniref:D(2) dopamine receptor A n=1 Tax=Holothuria leucospilota TaxID=206669 RepID=A0A9Q1BF18_HOLLE|nr:D(2) dopamine receptor A [Holothuria leucospilota]
MSSICLSVFLSLLSVTGAFGNGLVIVAVSRFASLKTISNHFILSLSFADFFITTLVMPPAIYNYILRGKWYAGKWSCAIWSGFDVLFCTASIFSLCAVSVDRYRSITKPVKYSAIRKRSLAYKYITIVWLGSIAMSTPFVVALSTEDDTCSLSGSKVYSLISSMISFFIPCTMIVFIYVRIYQVAKYTARNSIAPAVASVSFNIRHAASGVRISSVVCAVPQSEEKRIFTRRKTRHSSLQYCAGEITVTNRGTGFRDGGRQRLPKSYVKKHPRSRISLMRERKAARTITIVVGVFLVCWTPFFFIHVFFSLFPSIKISWTAYNIFKWLGWANSVVNPIIYTIFNKDFRVTFKKILHLEKITQQRNSRKQCTLQVNHP